MTWAGISRVQPTFWNGLGILGQMSGSQDSRILELEKTFDEHGERRGMFGEDLENFTNLRFANVAK